MKVSLRRTLPRLGWIEILLLGALLTSGAYYIDKHATKMRVLEAAHDLPAFSIVKQEDFHNVSRSARPPDAVSKFPLNGSWVTIVPLQAGEILRKSHGVPFSAGARLDLLVTPIANPVVANPGDELHLIGMNESQIKGEELGSAIFLGEIKGQIALAIDHKDALRIAPFSAPGGSLMAVRSLLPGRSEAAEHKR